MAPRRQQEEGQANGHAGHWLHVVLGTKGNSAWPARDSGAPGPQHKHLNRFWAV